MTDEVEALISTHSESQRTAIVDVSGATLWLYLTEGDSLRPVSDCWLKNLDRPVSERTRDAPPPAPSSVLIDGHNELPVLPQSYQLEWAPDGEAVRVNVRGETVAFVTAMTKQGFHTHLRTICPWGSPFDQELYWTLFGTDAVGDRIDS